MTCRSCGFANMKNARVCARCGAKLVWEGTARKRDFRPSLSRGWRVRWRNRLDDVLQKVVLRFTAIFPHYAVLRRMPPDNRIWTLASIVPGVGQLLQGRFVRGVVLLSMWFTALLILVLGHRNAVVTDRNAWRITQTWYLALLMPGVMVCIHSYAVTTAMRTQDFCRTRNEARLLAFTLATIVLSVYFIVAYMYNTEMLMQVRRAIPLDN